MKKLLLLILLYLMSSCYDDPYTNPYQPYEFMGMWGNVMTINSENNYSFLLTQDGATLYKNGWRVSQKYIEWKVYNDSLFLRKSPSDPDLEYKIIVWPTWPTSYNMVLGRDSIIYKLYKSTHK